MKYIFLLMSAFLLTATKTTAQVGSFSLGTRNTFSSFNDDKANGIGIGGQMRLQFTKRLNTEWFFDYITSKNENITYRNDYHIGWSVMYYPGRTVDYSKLLQPYFLAGHCFDYSKISEQSVKSNNASRLSMATQAGLGTHINITKDFDCSLSSQYMIHFGKDIQTKVEQNEVIIQKKDYPHVHGHLLMTVSFNYKFGRLWRK